MFELTQFNSLFRQQLPEFVLLRLFTFFEHLLSDADDIVQVVGRHIYHFFLPHLLDRLLACRCFIGGLKLEIPVDLHLFRQVGLVATTLDSRNELCRGIFFECALNIIDVQLKVLLSEH